MLLDAFLAAFIPDMNILIISIVAALSSIAAVLSALIIFRSGVSKVLDFVQGTDNRPKVGMQYEEVVNGKAVYRTWTKKDDYYYNKGRSRR